MGTESKAKTEEVKSNGLARDQIQVAKRRRILKMNLGQAFVIEVPEEREAEFLALIKLRLWNYPIVKRMPFGWFLSSIDGRLIDTGGGGFVHGCYINIGEKVGV